MDYLEKLCLYHIKNAILPLLEVARSALPCLLPIHTVLRYRAGRPAATRPEAGRPADFRPAEHQIAIDTYPTAMDNCELTTNETGCARRGKVTSPTGVPRRAPQGLDGVAHRQPHALHRYNRVRPR